MKKRRIIKLWSVILWIIVWQVGSLALNQDILLVSPLRVVKRLSSLVVTPLFWNTIGFSLLRIICGFLLATIVGVILSALAYRFEFIKQLVAPVILTIKATPVASFIILLLIWVSSKNLSVIISFLMVLPVIYTNVLSGIESTDAKLLEMAKLFNIPTIRTIRYIYLSQVLPYFRAGCSIGLGLCWKAGIAAEVIGIPSGSIGESLYNAKIYLDTADLFAWTVTIIFISLAFEKLFIYFLDRIVLFLERI